jgi:hypothetical protein
MPSKPSQIVRPRSSRVRCRDDEITATFDAGVDDEKCPGVLGYVGREQSFRDGPAAKVHLSGTIYRVADLNLVH